jgi:hypothetical protein
MGISPDQLRELCADMTLKHFLTAGCKVFQEGTMCVPCARVCEYPTTRLLVD